MKGKNVRKMSAWLARVLLAMVLVLTAMMGLDSLGPAAPAGARASGLSTAAAVYGGSGPVLPGDHASRQAAIHHTLISPGTIEAAVNGDASVASFVRKLMTLQALVQRLAQEGDLRALWKVRQEMIRIRRQLAEEARKNPTNSISALSNSSMAVSSLTAASASQTEPDIYTYAGGPGGPGPAADVGLMPTSVAVYGPFIYVADIQNEVIRRVNTSTWTEVVVAGNGASGYSGDGGPATSAELDQPLGVAVDVYGNLYIADTENCRIRKVDTSGIITTVAGNGNYGYSGDGGPATSAEMEDPTGVAVDVYGNLYFADECNNCIRKVNTSGIITTVAGNGTQGYSGDGGPATSAELDHP